MMKRVTLGGIRMPLVGCLAILGVFIAGFVLLFLIGYAKVKSSRSVPSHSVTGQAGFSPSVAAGSPRAMDSPSRLPFTPPEGFVVRPVRRELPCGATVEAYLLIPAYANPCGQ